MGQEKQEPAVVVLAGNPNVGKSTVFNALTGMRQHTGNWTGKTVETAFGEFAVRERRYRLVDLPGTYSLVGHSAEEEVAGDFLCFTRPQAVVIVCDAACLERNLYLVLQTLEVTSRAVVCVNLLDEAEKRGIAVDLVCLERELGVPVIGTAARNKRGLRELTEAVDRVAQGAAIRGARVLYNAETERAVGMVEPYLKQRLGMPCRWLTLRLLEGETGVLRAIEGKTGYDAGGDAMLAVRLARARAYLEERGISRETLQDGIAARLTETAREICKQAVVRGEDRCTARERKIDRVLTGRWTGIPVMAALLALVFWITISGANYPSELLSRGLFWVQDRLTELFVLLQAPDWLHGALVLGAYRVLAWVVAVMLPPMAIFFPLFTLLEDLGYLPRVAFNLDHCFQKACSCGKQALTMCMGFGCNAAGVVGCRIIDSPRERLVAMLTNNFVPCNGRFPAMITLISLFFVGSLADGVAGTVLSTLMLTGVIILGVMLTLGMSALLSKTLLKGQASSFALELPPYRRPQVGKVIVRSLRDRTVFVLGRAAMVAAPAGLIIWLLANVTVGEMTLLSHCAAFLDPFGRLFGMDGTILFAFILGFPANEIVLPVMIMTYLATGTITGMEDLTALRELLVANGWTWVTALCVLLFSLVHWPCSTTCLSMKKESGSWKWTALGFLLPTVSGFALCFVVATLARVCGFLV